VFATRIGIQQVGDSQPLARQHDTQVSDEHFARDGVEASSSKARHNPTQQLAEPARNAPHAVKPARQ
jgi:hypothetical protein